jgi:flavodoxin
MPIEGGSREVILHERTMEVNEMNSIVIYTSHFGNTKKVAEAIAAGLRSRGTAQVLAVDEVPLTLPHGTDLVVIGGPTEVHGMTKPLAQFFDRLGPGLGRDTVAAAFDTRVQASRWLSGSAAVGITRKLRQAGACLIVPVESFFAAGKAPDVHLLPGELERATRWGASLAAHLEILASAPVAITH